jgi:inorganic pyrophosphatase
MPKIDTDKVPLDTATGYPPPFNKAVEGRARKRLSRAAGLTQFGVNICTLRPGAASSQRHWHESEDELVYVLSGEVVLREDGGETVLKSGDAAAWKAGVANGHCLINRSDRDAVFLEVGTRAPSARPSKARSLRCCGHAFEVIPQAGQLEERAMRIDAILVGRNPPDDVNVVVEVPIGGEPIKYEMDKAAGTLVVDRFLYTSMRYPGNYGFIPHTLSGDGDPCDVLIANTRAIVPGAVMSVRPVGVLVMEDNAGEDEKIVAVPSRHITQRYDRIENHTDLPEITIKQIEHFFSHYKDLEPGKWVKIKRWADAAQAKRMIVEGMERARGQ